MKKLFILGVMSIIGVIVYFGVQKQIQSNSHSTHYHAGFTVFVDGTKQDFSGYQYMNFTPCTEHDGTKSPAEEQVEKAHLHDGVGDVVHVHRQGAVWGDLFTNIKYTFPDMALKGYVDGVEMKDVMSSPILDDQSVIIVAGDSSQADMSAYVTLDRIHQVEAQSELCGSN